MEIWKDVPGYEGLYQASDKGRLKSFIKQERILKGSICKKKGYVHVSLHKNNKRKSLRMHQVIMMTFVGKPPLGKEVCHKDGNPSNNELSNLYYGTRVENQADCTRHGTRYLPITLGELNPRARLDSYDVQLIRLFYEIGLQIKTLAEIWEVSTSAISKIVNGRTWLHV